MKKIIFLLLIISLINPVYSQYIDSDVMPQIPTSPQAAAFQQYGEMAVNISTGIPDISIPVYEINHHGYKLPVVLKYNPIPLKPGYNFDVYGHGWNLSISSCISRTILSAPDEVRNFQLNEDAFREMYILPDNSVNTDLNGYNFARDVFNVQLPDGSSFRFVMTREGSGDIEYIILEDRKVKIECSSFSYANINSFIITDENGVKYTFNGSDTPVGADNGDRYVSWKLIQIDLPNSSEPIIFSYNISIYCPYGEIYEPAVKLDWHNIKGIEARCFNIPSAIAYDMTLLSSISYGNSKIVLNYKNPRRSEYNYVDKIQVYESRELLKEIQLDKTIDSFYPGYGQLTSLARLDSITIKGNTTNSTPKVFRFNYHSVWSSFEGTDHWGYLNTAMNIKSVANLNFFVGIWDGQEISQVLGDRLSYAEPASTDSCPNYYKLKASNYGGSEYYNPRAPSGPSTHGVIRKIIYPTGGCTEFEFENHKFLTHTDRKGNYVYNRDYRAIAEGGGFRIRKIINKNSDGTVANTKLYKYGKSNKDLYGYANSSEDKFEGVGEPTVDPTILTYMNSLGIGYDIAHHGTSPHVRYRLKNMLLGLTPDGKYEYFQNNGFTGYHSSTDSNIPGRWEVTISPMNFRKLLNGRQAVIYPQVTVYFGDNVGNTVGKSVYKYDIYKPWPDLFKNVRKDFIFEELYEIEPEVWVYDPEPKQYNNLTVKIDYKYDGQSYSKVKKENYVRASAASKGYVDYVFQKQNFIDDHINYTGINVGDYYKPVYHNSGSVLLQRKRTTLYLDNDSIIANESYGYNEMNQRSKVTTIDSEGNDIVTDLTYPTLDHTDADIRHLYSQHIISPVIEQITKKGSSVIAASKVDYDTNWSNCSYPLPSTTYKWSKSDLEYRLQEQILDYSANGNPLESVSRDGVHTCYIWAYNDRYPVVKVVNVTYSEVGTIESTILPNVNFETCTNPGSNTTHNSILKSFYSQVKEALPSDCLFYIYTYKPGVGISSETDSNGKTAYYLYDDSGRLIQVKDDNEDIIKRYKYNFAK